MKFTAKAEYGLAALADIAIHSEQGEKATTVEIAQRQNISHKYLEQILLQLRQANLIRASKGQKGGYSLMTPASGIHISDVLNALDSSILADAAEIGSESDQFIALFAIASKYESKFRIFRDGQCGSLH